MTADRLQALLTVWQERLGLQLWDIDLAVHDAIPDGEPLDEHTWMRTVRHSAYQRAVVAVASHLLDDGPPHPARWEDVSVDDRRVETILVHELLHCWVAPLTDVADAVEDEIRPEMYRVLRDWTYQAEERVVDTMARALVASFGPVPSEATTRSGRRR